MNRLVPVTAAFAALMISAPSFGADLAAGPYRKAPILAAPGYDWSGFYLGVFGGGGLGNHNLNNATGPAGFANFTANYSSSGGLGGVDAGYNWQFGQYLLGLEGDFAGFRVKGDDKFALGANDATDLRWAGTVRGRVGVAVDRLLLFGTAGWAYGDQQHTNTDLMNGIDQFDTSKSGWTAGGGIEAAISQNWIGKFEYRYYNFGNYQRAGAPLTPNGQLPYSIDSTYSTITIGLNYKFGGPVVARY